MNEDKPWLNCYSPGVPVSINPDTYKNLNEFFRACFEKYKGRVAFSNMGKEMSYDDLDKLSEQFAAYLHYRGLQPGDKMAIMLPNLLQQTIAIVGAIKAGVTIVNTNPLYTEREMLHQFTDSEINGILILENFASKLESILPELNCKTIIVTSIGEILGSIKGAITNFVVRRIKKMVPKYNLPNTVSFKQALKEGKGRKINEFDDSPDRVVFNQYTGGTTGLSKGAMLTNRNMIANLLQVGAIFKARMGEEDGNYMITPLPLYHIFALTVNCLVMIYVGAHSVLVTNPRDQGSIIKVFKKYPISCMTGLNTLFNALLENEKFRNCNFENLKCTVAGGIAMQTSVAERWEKVTGCAVAEGYGMTESSPVASVNPLDGNHRIGTIGIPIPSTDMRVVNEEYQKLPPGEIGEIQVKGPQVMKGYYNQAEETANAIRDSWLCTGDIGMMMEDGFFKIVDRKKDMINVSGFNVYPNEIEDIVASHEKVSEVACVGIPDDKSSERVKLFVVKNNKKLKANELMEFCKANLTGYKVPKEIEFVKELPKTTVGKIIRRKLRES